MKTAPSVTFLPQIKEKHLNEVQSKIRSSINLTKYNATANIVTLGESKRYERLRNQMGKAEPYRNSSLTKYD
jgi:hypothetical protein